MHGGKSTGAPMGNKNAKKHGWYCFENQVELRRMNKLIKQCHETLEKL